MNRTIKIPCFDAEDSRVIKYMEAHPEIFTASVKKTVINEIKNRYVNKKQTGRHGLSS